MTAIRGVVHVDVDECDIRFSCEYDEDRSGYRVTATNGDIDIVLNGTPEQLGAFADAIVRTVSKRTIERLTVAVAEGLRAGA